MATTRDDLADPSVQGPPASLLRVRDVAARLQVSTKTVYRLKAEGALAYVLVRGSLRFREADLLALETAVVSHPVDTVETSRRSRLV